MGVGHSRGVGHGSGGGAPPPRRVSTPGEADGPGKNGVGHAYGHDKQQDGVMDAQAQAEAQAQAQAQAEAQRAAEAAKIEAQRTEAAKIEAQRQEEISEEHRIQDDQRVEERREQERQVQEQADVAAWRTMQDRYLRDQNYQTELKQSVSTLEESDTLTLADRERIRGEREAQLVKLANPRDVPDYLLPKVDPSKLEAVEVPARQGSVPRVVAPVRTAETEAVDSNACPLDQKDAVRNGMSTTQYLFKKLHDAV